MNDVSVDASPALPLPKYGYAQTEHSANGLQFDFSIFSWLQESRRIHRALYEDAHLCALRDGVHARLTVPHNGSAQGKVSAHVTACCTWCKEDAR